MPASRTIYPRRCRAQRRGAVYVVVLGAALIVSLIGMTGLMVARLQFRRATQAQDWNEAGDLALSAIELGIKEINTVSTWRTTYTNQPEARPIAMGRGTMSYKFVDAALGIPGGDGSLNNNTYDPVRLHGIGRVGNTVRVYSVLLIGDVPLDVLRTTVATSGFLNVTVPTTASGGPLSANGLLTEGSIINGNVEAGSVSGSGPVYGTVTSPAQAKAMPDKTVFDAYKRMATAIPYGGGATWVMSAALLSNAVNPFGSTNANGIYSIDVPAGSQVQVLISHIKGTLVIDCQDAAKVVVNGMTFWEPNTADLPILLICHRGTSAAVDTIQPAAGTITEGSTVYTAQLKGLIHVVGATGAPSGSLQVDLGGGGLFQGTVVIDQDARTTNVSATVNHDANLYLNPPVGYSTGATMKIARGSCLWEAAP